MQAVESVKCIAKSLLFWLACCLAYAASLTAGDTAVIGWGSLIWNPGALSTENGFVQGGPTLPIAFSRVSGDGRLTLVIDPVSDSAARLPHDGAGRDVQTWYAKSQHQNLSNAIKDLRQREGCLSGAVGYVNLTGKTFRIRQINPTTGAEETVVGKIRRVGRSVNEVDIVGGSGIRRELVPVIKELISWTKRKNFDAAIWTSLPANFESVTGNRFSQQNGETYLRGLSRAKRVKALEYIKKAPVRQATRDGNAFMRVLELSLR